VGAIVYVCWGQALMYVPPQLTWPVGGLMAFPHGARQLGVGAVTVMPWLLLCNRVANMLAQMTFPQPTLALRLQPLPPMPPLGEMTDPQEGGHDHHE